MPRITEETSLVELAAIVSGAASLEVLPVAPATSSILDATGMWSFHLHRLPWAANKFVTESGPNSKHRTA